MLNFIKYNLHHIIIQIICIISMVMLIIFNIAWYNREQEIRAVVEEYEARLEIFKSPVETCYIGL